MTAHLVAMGGGGFSMSSFGEPTALDHYLLRLSGKQAPLVCFVPTASADDPHYINKFLLAYGTLGVRTSVLTLWKDAEASVGRLADADVVLVGGGNTVNLMALWQAHAVTDVLRQRYAAGDVVFGGVSAGAACWYQGFITDSFGAYRAWTGGLGLVHGSFCPHFDGEAERVPVYTEAVRSGALPDGYAADDGAAVHYADGIPSNFLSERREAKVYRVLPTEAGVLVEPQEMTAI